MSIISERMVEELGLKVMGTSGGSIITTNGQKSPVKGKVCDVKIKSGDVRGLTLSRKAFPMGV